MTGVTSGQTALATATDSDDVEVYSTGPLTTVLQTLANLFDSVTGHDHTGSGKGKPIGAAGIAAGAITPASIAATVWTAFTPGLNQAGALATSTASGRYIQEGKRVSGSITITANAAGTAGNNITITGLPVASLTTGSAVWGTYQRAAGAGLYVVTGAWGSTTSVVLASNAGTSNYLGSTPSFAVAVGDVMTLSFMYEAA